MCLEKVSHCIVAMLVSLTAEKFIFRGNERKTLEQLSSAADAIADSNRVEKLIRESQAWSLLPLQVCD